MDLAERNNENMDFSSSKIGNTHSKGAEIGIHSRGRDLNSSSPTAVDIGHDQKTYPLKNRERKKLPALNNSKDVSEIVNKVEKELERKEKDFIIQILSTNVPLEPIQNPNQVTNKVSNVNKNKSKQELVQDILEIKLIKPNSSETRSRSGVNKTNEKKLRASSLSATLSLRKTETNADQRASSTPFSLKRERNFHPTKGPSSEEPLLKENKTDRSEDNLSTQSNAGKNDQTESQKAPKGNTSVSNEYLNCDSREAEKKIHEQVYEVNYVDDHSVQKPLKTKRGSKLKEDPRDENSVKKKSKRGSLVDSSEGDEKENWDKIAIPNDFLHQHSNIIPDSGKTIEKCPIQPKPESNNSSNNLSKYSGDAKKPVNVKIESVETKESKSVNNEGASQTNKEQFEKMKVEHQSNINTIQSSETRVQKQVLSGKECGQRVPGTSFNSNINARNSVKKSPVKKGDEKNLQKEFKESSGKINLAKKRSNKYVVEDIANLEEPPKSQNDLNNPEECEPVDVSGKIASKILLVGPYENPQTLPHDNSCEFPSELSGDVPSFLFNSNPPQSENKVVSGNVFSALKSGNKTLLEDSRSDLNVTRGKETKINPKNEGGFPSPKTIVREDLTHKRTSSPNDDKKWSLDTKRILTIGLSSREETNVAKANEQILNERSEIASEVPENISVSIEITSGNKNKMDTEIERNFYLSEKNVNNSNNNDRNSLKNDRLKYELRSEDLARENEVNSFKSVDDKSTIEVENKNKNNSSMSFEDFESEIKTFNNSIDSQKATEDLQNKIVIANEEKEKESDVRNTNEISDTSNHDKKCDIEIKSKVLKTLVCAEITSSDNRDSYSTSSIERSLTTENGYDDSSSQFDEKNPFEDKAVPPIDAMYLNIPLSLDEENTNFHSPSVTYYVENEKYEGKVQPEVNSESDTEKWKVLPLLKDVNGDAVSNSSSSLNEERELSHILKKFIEEEGIDYDLYERYEEFLKTKDVKGEDYQNNDMYIESNLEPSAEENPLNVIINEINKLMAINYEKENKEGVNSLEFCSFCEGRNCAEKGQKSRNQSNPQLGEELTNGSTSHAENISSSQSGIKEACSTVESIENSDLKGSLTTSRNSKPQVTVADSHLTDGLLQKEVRSRKKSKENLKENEIKRKGYEINPIFFKEEKLVYSSPSQGCFCQSNETLSETNPNNKNTNGSFISENKEPLPNNVIQEESNLQKKRISRSRIPIRVDSDMLARFGPSTTSNKEYLANKYLPPIAGNEKSNASYYLNHSNQQSDNMVFDFLNPFKKYRARGVRGGRVPISVKPNPVKAQKGYEYEDLPSKRKTFQKRRNSVGKIYIQDPSDRNNILVAEEIGYVYGDPRKHVQQLTSKENRGIQTVSVKETKPRPEANKTKSILTKKKSSYLSTKLKQRKAAKSIPFTTSSDLQVASKLETPREKGDYIIYASKNLPKIKPKSVSFKEAERGIPSISSTIMTNPRERLYGNKRDVAIDSQNFLPLPEPYNGFKPAAYRPPVAYLNGAPSLNPMERMRNPLERRASLDGPLPPVRARAGDGISGEVFNKIHHSSSHPNLTQSSSGALLLPQENHPESPLRSFEDSRLLQAPSDRASKPGGAKKGWGRVRELTRKTKKDTVIDGFGSTSDFGFSATGSRVPGTNVPIVLLQGFFKGARGGRSDHRRPSVQNVSKLKLPKTLLEPNSLLRGALPILPTYLATFCLMLNVFVPGLGTLMSGWFGACVGRNRLGNDENGDQKFMSILVTAVTGVVQLFTVTFFLVGWFWSISWGILLVSIARKYKQFLLQHRTSMNRNIGLEMLAVNTR